MLAAHTLKQYCCAKWGTAGTFQFKLQPNSNIFKTWYQSPPKSESSLWGLIIYNSRSQCGPTLISVAMLGYKCHIQYIFKKIQSNASSSIQSHNHLGDPETESALHLRMSHPITTTLSLVLKGAKNEPTISIRTRLSYYYKLLNLPSPPFLVLVLNAWNYMHKSQNLAILFAFT